MVESAKQSARMLNFRRITALIASTFFVLIAAYTLASADFYDKDGSTNFRVRLEPDHGSVNGNAEPNAAAAVLYAPPGRQSGNAWKNPQVVPASGKALSPGRSPAENIVAVIALRPNSGRNFEKKLSPATRYSGCSSPVRAGPITA